MQSKKNIEPKQFKAKTNKGTPKRINTSIKKDPINPSDYLNYTMPMACEDCTHFIFESKACSLGYDSKWHLREEQNRNYILSGKVAICRFHEID